MTLNPYTLFKKALRNRYWRWPVIVLAVLYIISPVDLIPEILVPFLGFLDDGLILAILLREVVFTSLDPHEEPPKRVVDVQSRRK